MSDKLRKEVRKVLSEEMGVQQDIKNISSEITKRVINQIQLNSDNINDGRKYVMSLNYYATQEEKEKTNISEFIVNLTYQKTDENKVKGSYKSDKLTLQDDGSYLVYIELSIKPNLIDNLFKIKINSVISHELNHAFVDVKNTSGKNRLYKSSRANKMTRQFSSLSDLKKYPEIKEFNEMIYLSNPLEIQARIQETGVQIDSLDSKSPEETINYLLRFQPLSDAKKMIAYKKEVILKLDPKILQEYIDLFNQNLKASYGEDPIKIINNIDEFFDHYTDIINDAGRKIALRIYKLVANKKNIQESILMENTNTEVFNWVFGEYF